MSSAHVPSTSSPGSPVPEAPKKRLSGKTFTALALLAIAIAFALSNLESGPIRFLGFEFFMPVWIWFISVLVVGVVIGSLFPWFRPKNKKK